MRSKSSRSRAACVRIIAALCVIVGGCATAPTTNQIAPSPPYVGNQTANANPDVPQTSSTRKAFGRVVVLRDGEPTKLGEFRWSGTLSCEALVHRDFEDRGSARAFGEDGWFEWNFAPGDYVLAAIYCTVKTGHYTLPLNLHFKVATDEDSYVGHLGFDFAQGHMQHVWLRSNEAEAVDEFEHRHPGSPPITGRLAVHDRGPGTYGTAYAICGSRWKVECNSTSQGVEPTNPPSNQVLPAFPFAGVDSLTPKLQWKPVAAPDVHYDVVVWEAVRYQSAIGAAELYEPGRVVFYEQDLAAPEVALSESLKPGTKYFWSVRLRQNGDVSSWSRRGHRLMLIVVNSWSSGQWFGMKTP
jgi:hypothetical protein